MASVFQIYQNIPEEYCTWLYLLVDQVSWPNVVGFKRCIQKFNLSRLELVLLTWSTDNLGGLINVSEMPVKKINSL